MPLYSFECEECHKVFDLRATFQEKERGLQPECPQCHGQRVRQLISAGLLLGSRSAAGRLEPGRVPGWGGCSPGGGCCG